MLPRELVSTYRVVLRYQKAAVQYRKAPAKSLANLYLPIFDEWRQNAIQQNLSP